MTPLILAIVKEYTDVAKLLLSLHVDITQNDCMNHNALFYAVLRNQVEMVQFLCINDSLAYSSSPINTIKKLLGSSPNQEIQNILHQYLQSIK